MTTPFYRKNPMQDELQRTLGGPRPGVSTTMPVDPRTPAAAAAHRTAGVAAGQDMSWMDRPGATTVAGYRPPVTPPPVSNTPAPNLPPPVGDWDTPEGRNRFKAIGKGLFGGTPEAYAAVGDYGPITPPPAQRAAVGPTAAPPVQPSVFRGFTPKHAMEGFDFAREQNTGKSAKDAFAYLANQAPPPPLHDKAALGAWFTQYIKPGMDALGHNVTDVQGDKFRFKNWQGDYWVDYGRGAGAQGGALAWQADDANAPTQAAQGQGQGRAPVLPGQSDLWAEIMASLQAQQEVDPQALLLEQLR